jgi:hypothetical protein
MSIIKSGTTSTTAYTVEGNTDGDLSFVVNGSLTAATLDTSGNLGIGTSSPSAKFVVSNAGAQGFEFDPVTGILQVYNRSTSAYGEFRPYGSLLRFFTGTSPTEKMRLDSSGNLGIGTSSPATKLDVNGTVTGTQFNINSASYDDRQLGVDSTGFFIYNATDARYDLSISDSGNLGIGTSSPTGKLHVSGFAGNVGLRLTRDISTDILDFYQGAGVSYIDSSISGGQLAFATAGTERARIDASGNLGVGTSSPTGRIDATASSDGIEYFSFRNSNSGTSAFARFRIGNSGSENAFTIDNYGSNHSTKANITEILNQFNAALVLGTNGTERARISSTGIVTTPYQPSFSAYLAANENRSSGLSVVGGTWGTQHNTGAHYSTSTRRFTAPVSGVYVFQCIIATVGGTGIFSYLSAELWVNGGRVRIGGWGGGGSSYGQTSNSFTIYLNANDYAELASESSKAFTLQSGAHTMFAGYLVG